MFGNISPLHLLILAVAGLIILGPERLPGAVKQGVDFVRKARDYVQGATDQIRDELGDDFEQLRQPLAEIQKLRGMTPRSVITEHLLGGDDSIFTSLETEPRAQSSVSSLSIDKPLTAGEKPPFDTEAT